MAAAVLIPPSPQPTLNMSTRRPPLANVPNATNSPHRPQGLVPAKRSRTTGAQIEIPYGQPPPKKHLVDPSEQQDGRSPTRLARATVGGGGGGGAAADSRLFARRPTHSQPTAFEKKLVAARDRERQSQPRGTRLEKNSTETLDSIRQWQRHYRKAFPQFVFYFDSIPGDVRNKCSRQVVALGAVSSSILPFTSEGFCVLMSTTCFYFDDFEDLRLIMLVIHSGRRNSFRGLLPMWSRHVLFPLRQQRPGARMI